MRLPTPLTGNSNSPTQEGFAVDYQTGHLLSISGISEVPEHSLKDTKNNTHLSNSLMTLR